MFKNADYLMNRAIDDVLSDPNTMQLFCSVNVPYYKVYPTVLAKVYGKPMTHIYKILVSKHGLVMQPYNKKQNKNEYTFFDAKSKNLGKYLTHETCEKIGGGLGIRISNVATFFITDYGILDVISYGYGDNRNHIDRMFFLTWDDEHIEEVRRYVEESLVKDRSREGWSDKKVKNMYLATASSDGITKSSLPILKLNTNVQQNYNDDLPIKRIDELIKSDRQELILLHGEPGTGKTSLIRSLSEKHKKKDFIYFDFKLMSSIANETLLNFLKECKDSVLIIEDCEKLFTDRTNGNTFLNTMLNLTDGIIGEAFGIKFICTFNCNKNQIDKAVLRKGRLSLIYEFKKLSLEKTKQLLPEATEPMALSDIYHREGNGVEKSNNTQIGF